jgi:serine protease Do
MAPGLARLRHQLLVGSLIWCALLGALAFTPRAAAARTVYAPPAQFSSQPRGDTPATPTAPDFNVIEDPDGRIRLRVPATWEDVAYEDWVIDGVKIGITVEAAPNLARFRGYWNASGMRLSTIDAPRADMSPAEYLDVIDFSEECTYVDRARLRGGQVPGQYDRWGACGGGSGNEFFIAVAIPASGAPVIVLEVQAQGHQAQTTFDQIAGSLEVIAASSDEPVIDEPVIDEPTAGEMTADVIASALNVRSGPGTDYPRLGTVTAGERLVVLGQTNNCAWLRVITSAGLQGWVSGNPAYILLNTTCGALPVLPPTEVPGAVPPAEPDAGASSAGAAPPQSYDPSLGCYLFQNLVGPELTITFTNAATGQGETFKVPPNGATDRCFIPGRYTYTIDAPPPWNSVNGEIEVHAGDLYLFPIGVAD